MRGVLLRAVAASVVLLGGAAAVVLTVASDEAVDPEVVAHSVDLAREAGTARTIFTFTLDAPPGFEQQAVSFGGTGEFDFAAGRSHTTYELTGGLGGDGTTPDAPARLDMEIVVDGDAMFLRMPAPAAGATEARTEWFSVNAEELATVTGQQSLGLGATDPTQTLEYLRGASSRIDEVGREPVGDVDATHYRATVDLGRSVEPTPGGRRSLVKAAVEQFRSQFGTTEFAVDVWTDDAGLPRRFRFELDLADYDRSGRVPEGAIMSFTMELFDYGEPVDIASPPADQVGDLTALLQRLGLPE